MRCTNMKQEALETQDTNKNKEKSRENVMQCEATEDGGMAEA
jgi:hypothetical protein